VSDATIPSTFIERANTEEPPGLFILVFSIVFLLADTEKSEKESLGDTQTVRPNPEALFIMGPVYMIVSYFERSRTTGF
jgi:hypothetical protein